MPQSTEKTNHDVGTDDRGPLLSASGLVKRYDGVPVVNDIGLTLERCQVLGLLGPNGAGKTTTLRMLYGFIEPEAGTITYEGRPFHEHRSEIKRWIGVCTQEDTLDHDFAVRENLEVYASYFRPRVPKLRDRIDELIEQFGLEDHLSKKPMQLSGGFLRRLMIARSIIHRPRILFLDEPTTGLDPRARVGVWEVIDMMRRQGMGIVLTTHYMDEAERLSDDLLVLSNGRDIARGQPREILGDVLGEHVVVVGADAERRQDVAEWATLLTGQAPSSVLGELHIPLRAAQLPQFTQHFEGVRFELRRPTLDDLFLRLSHDGE